MTQNIIVQLCALVLMIIIGIFVFGRKRIPTERARIFRRIIIVTTFCIITDIVSIIAIAFTPGIIAYIACKAYLFMIMITAMSMFEYVCYDISELRTSKLFRILLTCLTGTSIIAMLLLPLEYYNEDGKIYSFGPAVDLTFVFSPLFIISIFIMTFALKHRMAPQRRSALRVWMLMQAGGAVIQVIDRHLLLISYGMALGIMIIYARLEIPDENIDRSTGVYRIQMLRDYLNQLYENNENCSCIIVTKGRSSGADSVTEETVIPEEAIFLSKISENMVFRGISGDFITVYPNQETADRAFEKIKERFRETWTGNVRLSPAYLLIPEISGYSSSEELFGAYQYEINNMDTSAGAETVLDRKVLDMLSEYQMLRNDIITALAEDRVETFLQPIYSVAERRFVSAEALARIKEKDGSYMLPGRFIPIAERSGLIEQLGERVFEQVCDLIGTGSLAALGIEYIEVNLSVIQCENRQLAERYSAKIKEYGIDPASINLEITESSTIKQRTVLLENMKTLREFGCSFSLDDFGTGESNLDYIVNMPVDIVKFDRTMTAAFFTNERASVMLESVIMIIKHLGLKIVAEGVEEKRQLDALSNLGIDYIQGFYFSKPLPVNEFMEFVREKNSSV